VRGEPVFAVVPLDEGDEEIVAMQKNARLMSHIAALVERAKSSPSKALAQIKAEVGEE
jgi:hypothetical protein